MIIGFSGRIGSGKDTVAARLVNLVDVPTKLISFAAKLKESAAAVLDVPVESFEEWKNDPEAKIFLTVGRTEGNISGYEYDEPNVIHEFTIREYLQRYGTEAHRDVFGQDFWVDQALANATDPDTLYLITDVRFDNEAEGILARGGWVVRVNGVDDGAVLHASEAGVSDRYINFTIDNDVRDDNFENLDRQILRMALHYGIRGKAVSYDHS